MITLKMQGLEAIKRDLAAIGRQAPYAASVALNTMANHVQQDVRSTLPGNFLLRRAPFIERTIYRQPGADFATRSKLQAAVRIHPERDVLAKHEEGGSKRPQRARTVAVPVNVPRTSAGIVRANFSPKSLMAGSRSRAFVVSRPGGDPVIAEELGRGRNTRIRVLWVLKRAVWLKPRLKFHDTAQRSIDRVWESAVSDAITKALSTAR